MAHDINIGQTQMIVRERRPWAVALLSIVTLGVYSAVWYYKVNREMRDYGSVSGDGELAESNPTRSVLAVTIGGLVVIPALVSFVRVVGRVQRVERIATGTARGGAGLIALLVGSEIVALIAGLAGIGVTLLDAGAYLAGLALIQARLNAVWRSGTVASAVAQDASDLTDSSSVRMASGG